MNINISEESWPEFFHDYGADVQEFWGLGRFKPRCEIGDTIYFRYEGRVVATATVSAIGKPGQDECGHSGKFRNSWKIYWAPRSFKDLRALMYDKEAQMALNRESRTKRVPVNV